MPSQTYSLGSWNAKKKLNVVKPACNVVRAVLVWDVDLQVRYARQVHGKLIAHGIIPSSGITTSMLPFSTPYGERKIEWGTINRSNSLSEGTGVQ